MNLQFTLNRKSICIIRGLSFTNKTIRHCNKRFRYYVTIEIGNLPIKDKQF